VVHARSTASAHYSIYFVVTIVRFQPNRQGKTSSWLPNSPQWRAYLDHEAFGLDVARSNFCVAGTVPPASRQRATG
jgi:hypothetical protein